MARGQQTGGSAREHWGKLAQSRHPETRAKAAAMLAGPELPESVGYLRDWLYQLHGTSGIAMDGAAPLSWSAIRDWASFVGIDPPPTEDEVSALRMLDALLRSESRPKQATPAPVVEQPKRGRAR